MRPAIPAALTLPRLAAEVPQRRAGAHQSALVLGRTFSVARGNQACAGSPAAAHIVNPKNWSGRGVKTHQKGGETEWSADFEPCSLPGKSAPPSSSRRPPGRLTPVMNRGTSLAVVLGQ
jgi:hypothetical protein